MSEVFSESLPSNSPQSPLTLRTLPDTQAHCVEWNDGNIKVADLGALFLLMPISSTCMPQQILSPFLFPEKDEVAVSSLKDGQSAYAHYEDSPNVAFFLHKPPMGQPPPVVRPFVQSSSLLLKEVKVDSVLLRAEFTFKTTLEDGDPLVELPIDAMKAYLAQVEDVESKRTSTPLSNPLTFNFRTLLRAKHQLRHRR